MCCIFERRWLAHLGAILALTLATAGAAAEGLTGKPGTVTCLPTPGGTPRPACIATYAKLDKLLATKDWGGLGAALSNSGDVDAYVASIDWLSEQVTAGRGGFFVVTFLARDYWTLGNDMAALGGDLRLNGALMSLYALSVIQTDGVECADRSSPGARTDQLMQLRREAFLFLGTQSPDVRSHMIATVVGMDRKIGPLRAHNDENLCNFGMDRMSAGIEAGLTKEIPNPGGYVGKTVGVDAPPGWKPKYRPPSEYEPEKAKVRQALRDTLTTFVDSIVKAKAAP